MLIKAENGNYLKYQPTKEEVIKMFSEWKKQCVIRPSEIPDLLKENLNKWGMIDLYPEIKDALKIKDDTSDLRTEYKLKRVK